MKAQPKALYLLNFVSMWECFSYYGMRALLVLFMIHELQLSDHQAFGLYALYTTFVELGGVIGGIVADRYLGLKPSIALGGWTIVIGHLCLAIPEMHGAFFLGLGLIIAGTSLFRSNVAALLGKFYEENDPRRDAGYTIYYTGINIGGFLATLLCGTVGELYGWHAGFSLAALGMLSGNIALLWGWKLLALPNREKKITRKVGMMGVAGLACAGPLFALAIFYYEMITPLIPFFAIGGVYYTYLQTRNCSPEQRANLLKLSLFIVGLIAYFLCEEQMGSSLLLFSERHVDRETWMGIMPSSSLIMFNPLTILIAGPLLSRIMQKWPLNATSKIILSFLFLGSAFSILYCACLLPDSNGNVSLGYVVASIVLIALGEIFIAPTVFALASKAAPQNLQGVIMGMVTLGFAMANLFSGMLSQSMAVIEETSSILIYSGGFKMIGLVSITLAILMLFINKIKRAEVIA